MIQVKYEQGMSIVKQIVSFFMAILMFFFPMLNLPEAEKNEETMQTDYTYVFVHGLSGWGSYDFVNHFMPYWGMFTGSLMTYLNARGFDCCCASVSPTASAWDRACELYAQLTGTRTDYGKAHSEQNGHDRYGTDFTGRALVDSWNEEDKINILGHSFGGATVRTLSSLLAVGSEEERAATPENELSSLFTGGKGDWIYSLVTLAAPHNGTTSYDVKPDDSGEEKVTVKERVTSKLLSFAGNSINDGRSEEDSASYDMTVDHAMALNEKLVTVDSIYYFSFACCATEQQEDGTWAPIEKKMESLFIPSAERIGKFTGVTPNGYVLGPEWQQNDGLVNTISALYPSGAPHTDFDESNIQPGVWNVMPVYDGDHMSLQGGMTVSNEVRTFYVDLMNMINGL